MFHKRTLCVAFGVIMLLAGCGQKGALYMPSEEPQSKQELLKQTIKQQNKQQPASIKEKSLKEQDPLLP